MGDLLAEKRGRVSRLASSHDCPSTALPLPLSMDGGGIENAVDVNINTLRTAGGPQDVLAGTNTAVDVGNVLEARAQWLEEVTPSQRFWSPA